MRSREHPRQGDATEVNSVVSNAHVAAKRPRPVHESIDRAVTSPGAIEVGAPPCVSTRHRVFAQPPVKEGRVERVTGNGRDGEQDLQRLVQVLIAPAEIVEQVPRGLRNRRIAPPDEALAKGVAGSPARRQLRSERQQLGVGSFGDLNKQGLKQSGRDVLICNCSRKDAISGERAGPVRWRGHFVEEGLRDEVIGKALIRDVDDVVTGRSLAKKGILGKDTLND